MLLEQIKDKLVKDEWNINTLNLKQLGKGMILELWKRYNFKIGMLA